MATESPRAVLPTGIVAAIVFAAALVALLVLLDGGGEGGVVRLVDYDPRSIEAAVEEGLAPVRLTPSSELRVTGRQVRWLDDSGQPFLESPTVTMTVRLGATPDGGVLLSAGVIHEPRVRLVQLSEERWNYERPLAGFLGDGRRGDTGAGLAIHLREFTVVGGYVLVDLLDARYEARSLNVQLASAQLSGPGLDAPTFRIRRADAELVLPDTAEGRLTRDVTVADALIRLVDGTMVFDVDRATFGTSRLAALQGVWDPAVGGYGLDMRLTGVDARVADLPWLPGEVPEGAAGSFELRIQPRPGDRTLLTLTQLDLRAPGSTATGSFRVVIGGPRPIIEGVDVRVDPLALDLVEAFTGPLPYGGSVTGTIRGTGDDIRFELRGRLTTPTITDPFTADLVGRVATVGDRFTLRDAGITFDRLPLAALDALFPGIPLTGPITGTVQLTGAPGEAPLQVNVRFEAGGGIMTVLGMVDVSGPVPVYDLSGELIGLRLASILDPAVPPVDLDARFTLAGRGTDPRTANVAVTAHGGFTGWESEPGDTLALEARVADGTVDVRAMRLDLGPIRLAAAGEWDFVGGVGTIGYDLAIADLRPLGPYLPRTAEGQPRFARGTLHVAGSATGTLDAPALAGEIRADEFRWGEWAATTFSGDYTVRLTEGLPRIDTELAAEDLRTPFGNFDALDARIDFGRPNFQVVIRADQEQARGILALEADGIIDETGRREIFLRNLEMDLQQERWRLPAPARIAWTAGDVVRLDALELIQVDGAGRIAVQGVVAPVDSLDMALDVAGLPVGDLLELMGSDADLAGDLSMVGRVTGPAANPDLDVDLTLSSGTFRGVAIRSVQAQLRYQDARLLVDGEGFLGDTARIRIAGAVPARLQLAGTPLFALVDDDAIDLQIVTRTFPLATLDPGLATVEDLTGRIEANLRVGGTPAAPRLSGSAQLLDGALTIPLLGRRFENIRGAIMLSGREAILRDVVVESDGTARLAGTLDFGQLTNPTLQLRADLDRFRVQDIDNETAAGVSGQLELAGTLKAPVMSGSLRADNGAISLMPLQQPELSARLAGGTGTLPELSPDFDLGAPTTNGGIRIQGLTVTAGNDVWFVTEELRARLAGTLTVNRTGSELTLQGILQGQGGTFDLAAGPVNRRFQIVSSEIRFLGSPEPNPRIDIVASRLVRVPDGVDVDVRIQVGGSFQNPTLSLGTAAGADVPESELLSFLMFGRPTTDLGQVAGAEGFVGAVGQGLAYTGLAELFLGEITGEIRFLDYLRIDYVPGAGLFATAGKELGSDLFLNADFPLSAESNISAIGLEWQTSEGTFRAAYEPVELLDRLVGTRALSLLRAEIQRQVTLAWRRRWTY